MSVKGHRAESKLALSLLDKHKCMFDLTCAFFAACKCGQNAGGRVHSEKTGAEDHDEICDWVSGAGALTGEDPRC